MYSTSLVFAFGLTTATNYGIAGSFFGGRIAARLAKQKRALSIVFAVIVAGVGVYVVVRGLFG